MKVSLRLRGAAGLPPSFEHGGPTIRVGSDPQSELALEGIAVVSWRHARIELTAGAAYLSDVGSTNGTYLNSRRLSERATLRVGDRIQLGQTGPILEVAALDLTEVRPPRPAVSDAPAAPPRPPAAAAPVNNRPPAAPVAPPRPAPAANPQYAMPAAPPRPAAAGAPAGKGAAAAPAGPHKPAAPRRFTGATLLVGLVSGMQRRERRMLLAGGAAILLLLGAVAFLFFRRAPDPTAIYQRTVRSTAWVLVAKMQSSGSGALINRKEKLLLTAYHVIQKYENQEIFVFFPDYENGEVIGKRQHYLDSPYQNHIRARVHRMDPGRDLALLKLDRVPDEVPELPLADHSPKPAERVLAIGNPEVAKALWDHTPGAVKQVSEESFDFQDPEQHIHARVIVTDGDINPGDSGGPLVNDDGRLVGVISNGTTRGGKVNFCIDISEIRQFLNAAP
jgi:S1-C subfamily serine protease